MSCQALSSVSVSMSNQDFYIHTVNEAGKALAELAVATFYHAADEAQNSRELLLQRVVESATVLETKSPQMFTTLSKVMASIHDANFFNHFMTAENQNKIASLDARTKRVFWGIVMKAYAELQIAKAFIPITFSCFLAKPPKPNHHVQVISELALPIVNKAIQALDARNKEILDGARSTTEGCSADGLSPELLSFFAKFGYAL